MVMFKVSGKTWNHDYKQIKAILVRKSIIRNDKTTQQGTLEDPIVISRFSKIDKFTLNILGGEM